MEDCKILYAGDEDQNLKAGLLEELGFKNIGIHDNMSKCWLMTYDTVGFKHVCTDEGFAELKELTLPQLRDLVVLHRNDLNDRTHVYTTSTGEDLSAILLGDWWHIFTGGSWQKFTHKDSEKSLLMDRIQPEAEQGLISEADVPALLKKGQFVQYRVPPNGSFNGGEWVDINLEKDEEDFSLGDFINARYEWRLKPRTIKLELEIPAPFEPKVGEEYFYIQSCRNGYAKSRFNSEHCDQHLAALGAWRTEEEIKQVVAALRGIKG